MTDEITVVGGNATAFTGTATGYGAGGLLDGAVTLGRSAGGPTFTGDDKWVAGQYGGEGSGSC